MGVFINAATHTLNQTASVPTTTSFTVMGDCRIAQNTGASNIQPMFCLLDATLGDGILLFWNESATYPTLTLLCSDASVVTSRHAFVSRPEVGREFNWYVTCSGTGAGKIEAGWRYPKGRWSIGYATVTGTISAPTQMIFGQIAGAYYAFLTHQNIKIWNRALTSDELMLEGESWSPVVLNGLHSWCPLISAANVTDLSRNGRNMTASGTLTTRPVPFPRGGRSALMPYEAPTGGVLAGSAGQSFTNTATLAGRGSLAGSCAMAFGQSVALAGRGALAGPSALAFTNSATVAGRGVAAGTASIAFTNAGTVLGRGALAGSAAQTFADAAALTGRGALVGASAITFANSGAFVAAGSISGACALTFANAGTIVGRGALAGSAAQAFTNAGALTGYAPIAGSAAITFANSATLLGGDTLVGTCTITFAVAGTLAGRGPLAGIASLTFANSAAIKMIGPLAGAAALGFTAAGVAAGRGALVGSVAASFTGQAAMAGRGVLAGSAAITFTLSATDNSTGYEPPDHGRVLNIRPESREYLIRAESRTLGIQ